MKKILKSLVAAMIVSTTIVTASTPTITHAAGGDWRKDSIGGGIEIRTVATQRANGRGLATSGTTLMGVDISFTVNGNI